MILTGQAPAFSQKIYPQQTGFAFEVATEAVHDMQIEVRGRTVGNKFLTGAFTWHSGKIYDTNDKFFACYNTGTPCKFKFHYTTGKYSTWINDVLTSAEQPYLSALSTSRLTGLAFSGSSQQTIELSCNIYGDKPFVYFSPLATEDLQNFSGFYRITGQASELFSLTPYNATGSVVTPGSVTSGRYYVSGVSGKFTSGSLISIDFSFDFGKHSEDVPIFFNYDLTPTGYLTLGSYASVTGYSNTYNEYYQIQDFNHASVWPTTTTQWRPKLSFLYRSGYINVYGTGIGTGLYSGYISGAGYLRGDSISGYVDTGYYYYYTGIQHPTGIPGGLLITGTGLHYAYATGRLVYSYRLLATGYEETIFYTQDDTTGWIDGYLTGEVGWGSGEYHFLTEVSGRPQVWSGNYSVGNGRNSGYYDAGINPTSQYLSTHSSLANYLYQINYTGILDGVMYNYPGTGTFTGIAQNVLYYTTGKHLITGFEMQTGDYSLFTGTYENVRVSLPGLGATYGWDTALGVIEPPVRTLTGGVHSTGIRIHHDRKLPWGVNDYAELQLSNEHSGIIATVEGYSFAY